MGNIIHLNTLLGIMITMLLGHYIYLFHKQLLKNYNKIWEKNCKINEKKL